MVVPRNCEESESDKAIEYSEELNCLYFPPSPTYFLPSPTTFPPSPSYSPLYSPPSPPRPSSSNSSVTYVWDNVLIVYLDEDMPDFRLALLVEHKIQDRGGALDVIPSGRLVKINELVQGLDDIVDSEAKNQALRYVDEVNCLTPDLYQGFDSLEKQNEDIVDQLVIDSVGVKQYLIQYRDGALNRKRLGRFARVNGSEHTWGQLLTSTAETGLIFQTKLSLRVWQGHRGQWVADIWYGWNWLNTGTLTIAEGAPFSSESVSRFRGGKDLFDYPFSELLVNETRAEPTTTPRTEIQILELSPTEEQEKPDEDFELGCSEATGNDGVEAEATRNDGVEAVGIHGCDGTPIQGYFGLGCNVAIGNDEFGAVRTGSESTVEGRYFGLGCNVAIGNDEFGAVRTGSESTVEGLYFGLGCNVATGNDEFWAVGTGSESTQECQMAEAPLNSGCLGKKITKEENQNPRGERRNKNTTAVKIAKHLKASPSTLKQVHPGYNIDKQSPHEEHKLNDQSSPKEDDVIVKAYGSHTLKFRLSRPWEKAKLEEQVKKRLPKLEAGTYHIKYKDEDGELISITCDEDLQLYIETSRQQGTPTSIKVLLEQK